MDAKPNRVATTLDEYLALMVEFLETPADAVNEHDLIEWCFQKWHGRHTKGGYAESTVKEHARDFDKCVSEGLSDSDRKRKISPRTS